VRKGRKAAGLGRWMIRSRECRFWEVSHPVNKSPASQNPSKRQANRRECMVFLILAHAWRACEVIDSG